LRTTWSVGAKFAFAFVGGIGLCWAGTAALRRIPLVRKVI